MTTSLIAKQRRLYAVGRGDPLGLARAAAIRHRAGLGGFGTVSPAVKGVGATASGAAAGAAAGATGIAIGAGSAIGLGAAAGSVVPIIGTAIGAIVGLIASGVLSSKKDPENFNFDQAVAMWQANRLSVLNIGNKYLVLAGLFDLNIKTNIPIYKRYGRMGEQKFVTDMMTLVYNAAQSGKITASDTPQTIMVNVVQPWIDSWGFGPMADPHADLINLILMGMIADYVAGNQTSWKAVGGDYPFASLPPFKLPGNTAPSTAAQYAPNSAVTTAPLSSVQSAPATAVAAAAATSALAANPFPGWNTSIAATDPRLGIAWSEAENGYNTTWSPTGGGYFTAPYPGSTAKLQVLMNGTQVAVLRLDSDGEWVIYQGTVGPDLQSVSGTATYYPKTQAAAIQYPWSATIPGGAGVLNTAPATGTSSSSTTVSVPAGYQLIGTANGLGAYQGLDGYYYSWNGATMSLLTGTLVASNGQTATILNGAVQASMAVPSLSSATQQTGALPSYQSYATSAVPYTTAGAPAVPAPVSAVTAGVDTSGLPSWLTWGAVAAAGYFMMATARPLRGGGPLRGSNPPRGGGPPRGGSSKKGRRK